MTEHHPVCRDLNIRFAEDLIKEDMNRRVVVRLCFVVLVLSSMVRESHHLVLQVIQDEYCKFKVLLP